MATQTPQIEPIETSYRLRFLNDEQLKILQDSTLRILEEVGVRFPSQKALSIFAESGAQVDWGNQTVKLPPDVVFKAVSTVPRYFIMAARDPAYDLQLREGATFFTTDGCGVETIDFDTRQRRPSCKNDVAKMARIADYLPSIGLYWPMVSAQDYGKTAPLHEIDASWNNTVKHVQSETIMGEASARYAIEMATVLSGSREDLRRRPLFSLVVCTIAPLTQDKDGIEAALVLAEAGVPVGFLAMPTLGTTAPATLAGALVVGDAEVISATVLLQLAYPGCPVFHSIMHAWADPSTGGYISYPLDSRCRYAPVEMAHHWGIPSLGGAYGTDTPQAGSWQGAAEVALDPLMVCLSGAEIVTGIGLSNTYTLLYPEQIILDYDLLLRAKYSLMAMEVDSESLAFDTIQAVGPGGHYLAQKHTRTHMRQALKRSITHVIGKEGRYLDPIQIAQERVEWILHNHLPNPLDEKVQIELQRILASADRDLQ